MGGRLDPGSPRSVGIFLQIQVNPRGVEHRNLTLPEFCVSKNLLRTRKKLKPLASLIQRSATYLRGISKAVINLTVLVDLHA